MDPPTRRRTPCARHLEAAIQAGVAAGRAILQVYYTDFDVEHKADNSPLTLADKSSHRIITEKLRTYEIPILSEEGREIPYLERKAWRYLWVVDPLDGTKEFVSGNDEFTVNIALVERQSPVLGVVYLPVKNIIYFAARNIGAFRLQGAALESLLPSNLQVAESSDLLQRIVEQAQKLPFKNRAPQPFVIIGSRSHAGPKLRAFVEEKREAHGQVELTSAGSSLKFCLIAEGAAHVYPRLGPTFEWDTAAGQVIVENSGGSVLHYETQKPLIYNKEDLLNPWFVVTGPGLDETVS